MAVNDAADDDSSSEETSPPTRIVQVAAERPEDWKALYGKLSSARSHDSNALCDLSLKLSSLFDLVTVILRGEEHLAMLTVNEDNTVTLCHHLRASGSYYCANNNQGMNVVAILGVTGGNSSAPLLQFHSPNDRAFATVQTSTPANEGLLRAAKSASGHTFLGLDHLATQSESSEVKSFVFVPPAIASRLLQAGTTYMSPHAAASLVAEETHEAHNVIGALLRWLWCAQRGLLQPSSLRAPVDPDSASRTRLDLKRSYLQSNPGTPPPLPSSHASGDLNASTMELTTHAQKIVDLETQLVSIRGELAEKVNLKRITALEAKQALMQGKFDTQESKVRTLENKQASLDGLAQKVNTIENKQQFTIENKQLFTGVTPDPSNWHGYGMDGILITVDTSHCNFPEGSKPNYFTSIIGNGAHWYVTGTTSIYNAKHNSFDVYVRSSMWNAIATVDLAYQQNWRIQWVAMLG